MNILDKIKSLAEDMADAACGTEAGSFVDKQRAALHAAVDSLLPLLEAIEKKADEELLQTEEDFNAYDYSGGNYDDAFSAGERDGEISFAYDLHALIPKP